MLRHEKERRGEKKAHSFVYAFALMDLFDFISFILYCFFKIGLLTCLGKKYANRVVMRYF